MLFVKNKNENIKNYTSKRNHAKQKKDEKNFFEVLRTKIMENLLKQNKIYVDGIHPNLLRKKGYNLI